jgi:thymidylate synthase (FAD)
MNDGHHVSPYDNDVIQVGDDAITVKLVQGLNPEFEKVLSRATRATIGIDLYGPDTDTRDWEEMLKGGLQTALESQVIIFEVSGVSRACTHQIVRTRKAAFHQQSMRASFYGSGPEQRIPESIWNAPEEVRLLWVNAVEACRQAYIAATKADVSYQDARYILPEGTTNYILCEYPLREFINVYAYRGCSMFQWEIVTVMRMMRDILIRMYDFLDPYVKISCEKTHGALDAPEGFRDENGNWVENDPEAVAHTCTFQGWESVEGQCPFPWARESNRSFRSEHHRIEKKEA